MRIVIDTNIFFSAILNTNNQIAKIILKRRSKFNFYTTDLLLKEIENHRDKLLKLSNYSENELTKIISLLTKNIRFIDARLIPKEVYIKCLKLTSKVDIDDTEFVALTDHIKGKLWSGDRNLQSGLKKLGWNKFITTKELLKELK